MRLNLTKGDVITKLNTLCRRLWCDGPGVISRHPVSHSHSELFSRHLFSALIALPPSGVVLVISLDNSSSNDPLKVNFTKLKKTNQRKILNDFFLRRRRMDIFTKVSSLVES